MKSSIAYANDPAVVLYREELARRANRPKKPKTASPEAAKRDYRGFKVGKGHAESAAPRVRATLRQRVLYDIDMESLRRRERGYEWRGGARA